MDQINYSDFDLLIEACLGGYRARVLESPGGEGVNEFRLPFSDLEIENLLLRMGRARRGMRRIDSPALEAAKTFGARLFDAVFAGDVKTCFDASIDAAEREDKGLRMRLRLGTAPELAQLPWEYLYSKSADRFLSLSKYTPLIRYLDLPERVRPLHIKPPLKVLVACASPSDYAALDVEREWENLRRATLELQENELVTLDRLDGATLDLLERRLGRGEYHIFHFIGHGGFDRQTDDGVLLLQDRAGRGRSVSAAHFGTLLRDHRKLRLAILNACEGARSAVGDPFSGVAQSLVRQGIPAVIAMQFEVSDEAAITFAQGFYTAVADGQPIDAALAQARKAIFFEGLETEWGTPVLYLRSPDGRIFELARAPDSSTLGHSAAQGSRRVATDSEPTSTPGEEEQARPKDSKRKGLSAPQVTQHASAGKPAFSIGDIGTGAAGKFVTAVKVWGHIRESELAQKDERVKHYLLLFQSDRRRIWLVFSDTQLFCVLDDCKGHRGHPVMQWTLPLESVRDVRATVVGPMEGRLDVGERKDWLYSPNLHSDPRALEQKIRSWLPGYEGLDGV
jgi:hypothetical protein